MSDNNSRNLTANFTADTSGFSPKINELVQRLKTASQEFENNKTKIAALKAEMRNYQSELSRLENTSGPHTAEQTQQMQTLRERIAACATQLGTFNAAQRQLQADMNATNRELADARNEFNSTGEAAATFGEVLKANIASEAILGAIRELVNGLRQAAAYCYSTGSAFEAGMSKVAAVSGASADELDRLTEKAKELGSSTKFTATETAEAMNYMAMAGWKTEQMLEGIDGVLGLAAASGTDLATTSDIVTDALTAFGMQAEDCVHFADILAAASSNANTNVAMMGETFKYCAPIAGALGFEAEDVAVGIGLMANAGVKASNAGTAMRKFMTELSEGLTITGKKIGEVTIATSNADGTMRSYAEIVGDLRNVFAQLDDNERASVASDIVGQNAVSGFLAMMNASEDDVNKLTEAIKNCDGAAANMAETMGANVQGAVTKMNSALEGVGISMYDKFKGGLLDAVNVFTDMLGDLKGDIDDGGLGDSVEELGESFKNLATEGSSIVKDVLPVLINLLSGAMNVISTFGTEIGSAVKAFITFKAAMAVGSLISGVGRAFVTLTANINAAGGATNALKAAWASNPFGMIATGVSVAVFAISEFVSHSKKAEASAEALREKCDTLAQQTAEYKQKCDDLNGIKEQYEEISLSAADDAEKTEQLKNIQDQLISQYPELANQIDLVNGKYYDTVTALQAVIDKTSEAYKIQAEASMNALEKQERTVSTKISFDNMDFSPLQSGLGEAFQKYLYEEGGFMGFGGDAGLEFTGSYEERLEQMTELYNQIMSINNGEYKDSEFTLALAEQIGEVQKLSEELVSAQAEVDDLNKKMSVADGGTTSYTDSSWYAEKYKKEQAQREAEEKALAAKHEKELKAAKELYDKEKQLADDMYSVGELAEAEYYAKLTELRNQYLEEKTHDWYVATAKIKSYQDQNLKDQKSSLAEAESAYKKTLAAIDKEIERHNRAKSDAEYEKKLADIQDRLTYGRLDEFEKYELEKERKRLEAEREEELFKRETADAKAAAQEVYNAQKALDNAAASTKEYTMELGNYTDELDSLSGVLRDVSDSISATVTAGTSVVNNNDNRTINQNVSATVPAANKTIDQIVQKLLKELSSRL